MLTQLHEKESAIRRLEEEQAERELKERVYTSAESDAAVQIQSRFRGRQVQKSLTAIRERFRQAQVADAMASMFTEMDGDIDRIFETLGENPYKAKKYPPADAEEFGRKYAAGFYEYIGDKAECKK